MECIHRSRFAMGTLFEVVLRGDDAENLEAIAETILDEVLRVERLLTIFDSRSEVSRLHREAAKAPTLVDYELLDILLRCQDAWKRTDGHFDITCGRSHPDAYNRRSAAGMSGVHIDPVARTVFFADSLLRLDFGGVGKGYALERAAKILAEFHVDHAFLHGGTSSILAKGDAYDESPSEGWPVNAQLTSADAVSDFDRPLEELTPGLSLTLAYDDLDRDADIWLVNESLSCSAIRFSRQEISDIIHAPTGKPLQGRATCWVIGPSPVETEFLSTALLGMGKAKAVGYISSMTGRNDIRMGWLDDLLQRTPDWFRPVHGI